MMNQLCVVAALCAAMTGLLGSRSAHALLVDRGGGMLYDTVLNVTWLQDANYAKTSGHDEDGTMFWGAANEWANNLVFGGYNDWRLARNSPVNGTASGWNESYSNNGSTDVGFNITSPLSELSYMYYVNLGLKGRRSTSGTFQPDFGVFGTGPWGVEADVGLVKNLQSNTYWSGTVVPQYPPPASSVWTFSADDGFQTSSLFSTTFFAWAVHDGDIAAVPVPGSVALLAGGLALLGVVTRRRKAR